MKIINESKHDVRVSITDENMVEMNTAVNPGETKEFEINDEDMVHIEDICNDDVVHITKKS